MNAGFLVFSSTGGQRAADTLEEARQIAARMAARLPSFDEATIFEWLPGCPGDCTCGGQIHPQSVEVESVRHE